MTTLSVYYLVLLIPLIEAAWFRCDYSYIPHEGWFKLHWERTDHNTAKRMCLKEGAELVLPSTKELKTATLSVIKYTDVTATHIDYEAAAQRHKVRREAIKSTCFDDTIIPIVDDDNTTLVLTRNGSFETKPALAKIHFICHKKAGTAEELNECGTTDNEYTFAIQMGKCYKLHRFPNTWSRAKEICTYEGGNLAVINSEIEAQAIRDLIMNNSFDFLPQKTMHNLVFVGIKSMKNGLNWHTVDGNSLSMSGYEKWDSGEQINGKGDESCGTVKRNGLLYKNSCDREFRFICEKNIEDCNDKYTFDIRTGKCYKFHRSRYTYDQARAVCLYEGGNLAIIDSKGDAQAIGDLFNRNPSYTIPGDYSSYEQNMASLGKLKDAYSKPLDGDSLLMMTGYHWIDLFVNLNDNWKHITVNREGILDIKNSTTLTVPFICEKTHQECNGYTLDSRTGHCYKFHRIVNTWPRAFEICTNEGGNLAVINSETEAQVIRDIFSSNPPHSINQNTNRESAFLGIKRDDTICNWKSVDGYSLWMQSWAPGEPNNAHGDEYCVTVRRNGLLSDESCDQLFPFICEKKNEDCL